jgi:hypothetical protein
VCKTWKDLTREMDETVWNRFDSKHFPPNLNSSTLVSEKQNTKVTKENKNKNKNKINKQRK